MELGSGKPTSRAQVILDEDKSSRKERKLS
jgi:hypothetical protein